MPSLPLICAVLLVLVAYGGYAYWGISQARIVGNRLVAEAAAYEREGDYPRRILVLGDSTAVGVGAAPEHSVAGLLAEHLDAAVENYAVSGAVVADLPRQLARARHTQYDLVEIQIGANDVLGIGSLAHAASELDAFLATIRPFSEHQVLLTAGDIGNSPVLPWPLDWIVSYRTRVLREHFMAISAKHDVLYVDIYSEPDVFSSDTARYHAADGLHLSADGYAYWFEIVRRALSRWPSLERS